MSDLLIDSHKLNFHPHRVAEWLDSRVSWDLAKSVYPIYAEVSPVNRCNHACNFCGIDFVIADAKEKRVTGLLDADMIIRRLAEAKRLGLKSVMWAGEGEPLLHPRMSEMNQEAIKCGLDTSFTTNAVFLDRLDLTGTTWVKASVNAGSAETYAQIHRAKPGDWERVWENLRWAVSRRGQCSVGVQCVVLEENWHELPKLAEKCLETGVDYLVAKPYSQHKFSIVQRNPDYRPMEEMLTSLHEFETEHFKVFTRDDTRNTKEIPYAQCRATPYFWCYIMATGDVYTCSAYLLDQRFNIGNLNAQSFLEIWQGERRHANWIYVRDKLNIQDCRVNCRMDKANRYLHGFDHVQHISFI